MDIKTKQVILQNGDLINVIEDDFIGFSIESTKKYFEEDDILILLQSLIKPNAVIYDLGANIGNHSLYFSRHLKAEKVYSFEPVPFIFNVLQKNAELADNIIPFNIGLGEKAEEVIVGVWQCHSLEQEGFTNNFGGTGPVVKGGNDKVTFPIQIVSLDSFILDNESLSSVKILPPDFIKIDVEHYELNVLKGATKLISLYKPVILLESFEASYLDVNDYLIALGYNKVADLLGANYIYVHKST